MTTPAPPAPPVARRAAAAALSLHGDRWHLDIDDPAETQPVITGPWPDGKSLRDPGTLAGMMSAALTPRGWWTAPGCAWPPRFPVPELFRVGLRRTAAGWRRDQAEAILDAAGLPYHGAHEPYMAAVVTELTAAGVTVTEWGADTSEPRDGIITIASPDRPPGSVTLAWSDTQGWRVMMPGADMAVFEPQETGLRLHGTRLPLAATPVQVVTAVADELGTVPVPNVTGWTPPAGYDPHVTRPPEEPWDASPALEQALTVYVTHPAWTRRAGH